MSFDLEKEEQEYRKYKAEHSAGKVEKQNKPIDEEVKPGSGIRDFYVTIGLLLFQFVLTLIIAPFLIKDSLNEHTFQFFGEASAYASAVGLLITVVRNRRSYRRCWLILCAVVLFAAAILECRYVGVPAASIVFIVYFQIKNNNGKLRDELVALASTIVTAGIISIATLNLIPSKTTMSHLYSEKYLGGAANNSFENLECNLNADDSLFARNVFVGIYQKLEPVTKNVYERFNEIRKRCPSWLEKPDWSEQLRLNVLYYEDMVETIKQNKLVVSNERAKLGKALFEAQNRNLEKVLNGDLVIENGVSYLVDSLVAEKALENEKEIVKTIQAKLDSLYDSSLVFDDSIIMSDLTEKHQDSIIENLLNEIKNDSSCVLTPSDSEFIGTVFDGMWEGTLPINKDIHQRFQKLYKKCLWELSPPDWNGTVTNKILYYEDLASSMKQRKIVLSNQRKMLEDSIVKEQNSLIAEYLKNDTIYPQDGSEPFILDSEDVVYNLKKYQEKAIVALKKLDSLYNDSLYMK